jgi:hypothetical protein
MALVRAECRVSCMAVAGCPYLHVFSRSTRPDPSPSCPEHEGLGLSTGPVAPVNTSR